MAHPPPYWGACKSLGQGSVPAELAVAPEPRRRGGSGSRGGLFPTARESQWGSACGVARTVRGRERARDKIGSRVEREGHDIIGREGIREMASESHTIRAYTAATNEDTFSTQYAVRNTQYTVRRPHPLSNIAATPRRTLCRADDVARTQQYPGAQVDDICINGYNVVSRAAREPSGGSGLDFNTVDNR